MIATGAAVNRPKYDFNQPVDLPNLAGGDSVIQKLIQTSAFQRLKQIHFLGGIDYLLVPVPNGAKGNRRHTRYQHSLGVAHLASLYCDRVEKPSPERQLICIAALQRCDDC